MFIDAFPLVRWLKVPKSVHNANKESHRLEIGYSSDTMQFTHDNGADTCLAVLDPASCRLAPAVQVIIIGLSSSKPSE